MQLHLKRSHTVECRIKRRPPPAEHAHGLVLPTPGNCRGGPRPDRTRKRTMMKRKICNMISSTRSTGRRRSRKRGRKQGDGWRGKFWVEMMMNSHAQKALLARPRRGTSCNSQMQAANSSTIGPFVFCNGCSKRLQAIIPCLKNFATSTRVH